MKKEITLVGGKTVNKIKASIQKLLMAAMIAMSGMAQTASATATASGVMKQVVEIVVDIFPLFGGIFILLGVFTLFMAIKTDQPEKKNTAIMDIAIGSIMIVFRAFVWSKISSLF